MSKIRISRLWLVGFVEVSPILNKIVFGTVIF